MTVSEFYAAISAAVPETLSAEWDNDGLALVADETRAVRRVLVALDATERVVKRAITEKFDLLLTHHPLLFHGVKALDGVTPAARKLLLLAKGGVSAVSLHTRLDAVSGGVNDVLADFFSLSDVTPFGTPEDGEIGRVGDLPREIGAAEFAKRAATLLGAAVTLSDAGKPVKKIALVGGEGGDFVDVARFAGADLFLAGRIGYHRMLDAAEMGLSTIEAGHFFTEVPICRHLAELAREVDPTLYVEIDDAPTVRIMEGERV